MCRTVQQNQRDYKPGIPHQNMTILFHKISKNISKNTTILREYEQFVY